MHHLFKRGREGEKELEKGKERVKRKRRRKKGEDCRVPRGVISQSTSILFRKSLDEPRG